MAGPDKSKSEREKDNKKTDKGNKSGGSVRSKRNRKSDKK